jgi:hypothetical protein
MGLEVGSGRRHGINVSETRRGGNLERVFRAPCSVFREQMEMPGYAALRAAPAQIAGTPGATSPVEPVAVLLRLCLPELAVNTWSGRGVLSYGKTWARGRARVRAASVVVGWRLRGKCDSKVRGKLA